MSGHLHELTDKRAPCATPMCFLMPHIADLPTVADHGVQPDLMRLPYPDSYFEGSLDEAFVAIFAYDRPDGFEAHVHVREKDGAQQWKYWRHFFWDSGQRRFEMPDSYSEDEKMFVQLGMSWLAKFLTILNCTNVERSKIDPSTKLQRARTRRGKMPLFSYWELKIDLLSNSRVSHSGSGDTHSSPRIHLRRGHMRQYREKLWTWVTPHLVGNKTIGIVHKDYIARMNQQ